MIGWLSLSQYKILSSLELIASVAMFVYSFRRNKYFILRLILSLAVLFAAVWFFPIVEDTAFWGFLLYLLIFLLVLVAEKVCFCASWRNLLFITIAAYLLKHLAYVVLSILTEGISAIFDLSLQFNPYFEEVSYFSAFEFVVFILCYLTVYFFVYWFGFWACARKVKTINEVKLGRTQIMVLAGFVLVFAILFSLLMSFNANKDTISMWVERGSSCLLCVVVLWLLFSKLSETETIDDLAKVRRLLDEEQRQYASLKQNMDVVNFKCHDIKHMINDFRLRTGIFGDELSKIEDSVSILGAVVMTGNEVLDMVLTDKIYRAESMGITLSCIADGSLLAFMKPSDIYSMVGNALDNAINAVQKVEPSDRIVTFSLRKVNGMAVMHTENCFVGELSFVDGIPRTTSGDSVNHGYGMLSIRTIVESYGGTMAVEVDDSDGEEKIFHLNIIFSGH